MSTPQPETPPPAAAPPAGGRRKLLLVGAIGLVVLGVGVGAAWRLRPRAAGGHGPGAAPAAVAKPDTPVKATVTLGPVVVNLAGESRRYVRAGVAVGVAGPKDVKEIEEARAQITDLVIAVLAGADPDDLLSPGGRDELKGELLRRLHEEIRLEKVLRVYFTELVVQ